MKKFSFRLQKVLDYRAMVEQWAKDAYLDARSNRLEAELKVYAVAQRRHELLNSPANSLDDRKYLETKLQVLDDEERHGRMVVDVLLNEEEKALAHWTEKKVESEALNKMRDRNFEEWQLEMDKKMQAELDEWALRKKAA